VRPVPGDFVVAEPKIRVRKALLGRTATGESRFPAMKELMQQIQSFMINSGRMPDRLEFGKVGFLESDYFKDRLLKILPREKLDETVSIGQAIADASQTRISGEMTVGDLLKLDIAALMQKTDLDIDQALELRKTILGMQ
jgi:hypothetical protein